MLDFFIIFLFEGHPDIETEKQCESFGIDIFMLLAEYKRRKLLNSLITFSIPSSSSSEVLEEKEEEKSEKDTSVPGSSFLNPTLNHISETNKWDVLQDIAELATFPIKMNRIQQNKVFVHHFSISHFN